MLQPNCRVWRNCMYVVYVFSLEWLIAHGVNCMVQYNIVHKISLQHFFKMQSFIMPFQAKQCSIGSNSSNTTMISSNISSQQQGASSSSCNSNRNYSFSSNSNRCNSLCNSSSMLSLFFVIIQCIYTFQQKLRQKQQRAALQL